MPSGRSKYSELDFWRASCIIPTQIENHQYIWIQLLWYNAYRDNKTKLNINSHVPRNRSQTRQIEDIMLTADYELEQMVLKHSQLYPINRTLIVCFNKIYVTIQKINNKNRMNQWSWKCVSFIFEWWQSNKSQADNFDLSYMMVSATWNIHELHYLHWRSRKKSGAISNYLIIQGTRHYKDSNYIECFLCSNH